MGETDQSGHCNNGGKDGESKKFKIKALKKEWKHGTRVILDNKEGEAFLPKELAIIGREFEKEELVKTLSSPNCFLLKSTLPPPRKRVVRPNIRDMSKFKSEEELELIKSLLLKKRSIMGSDHVTRNLEDLKYDVFTYLWETEYFHKYDEKQPYGYASYIATAIHYWMISWVRSGNFKRDQMNYSLDFPLDAENPVESATMKDTIPDMNGDLALRMEAENLLNILTEIVTDMGFCDSCVGLTYLDLFNILISNGSVPAFCRKNGFGYKKVNSEIERIRDRVRKVLKKKNWKPSRELTV